MLWGGGNTVREPSSFLQTPVASANIAQSFSPGELAFSLAAHESPLVARGGDELHDTVVPKQISDKAYARSHEGLRGLSADQQLHGRDDVLLLQGMLRISIPESCKAIGHSA